MESEKKGVKGQNEEERREKEIGRTKEACPGFEGNRGKYETWKKRVWMWYELYGKFCENAGEEVLMSVGEEVFEEVSYLDVKELKEIGGEERVRKVKKE